MSNPTLPANHLVHMFASGIVTLTDALLALGTIGLDDSTMAGLLGMAVEQFEQRLVEEPTWLESWQRGKAKGLAEITRALHISARGGNPESIKMWLQITGNLPESTAK